MERKGSHSRFGRVESDEKLKMLSPKARMEAFHDWLHHKILSTASVASTLTPRTEIQVLFVSASSVRN